MSETITAELLLVDSKNDETTVEYLNSIGMTFDSGLEDVYLNIEVVNEPKILNDLRNAGIFKIRGNWNITKMSHLEITLYISCPIGDSYAFIPAHQIISIHTVDKSFLDKIQQQAKKK